MDYRFKILYALGIVFIVAGHCQGGGIFSSDFIPLYMFHVQLFIFCSGYFYKVTDEFSAVAFLWRKIRKLIIPLYLWNVFYGGVILILNYKGFFLQCHVNLYNLIIEPLITGHQFIFNLAGWFIVPLFMTQVSFLFLHKYICNHTQYDEYVCFMISFIIGIIGVALSIKGYNTGYYLPLVRWLYFFPFYALGRFYRSELEKFDIIDSGKYFLCILLLLLIIIFVYGHPLSYEIVWCRDFNNGVLMPLLVPIIGIAFWLRVAKIFEPSIGKSTIVNLLAKNTYIIMIHHLAAFFCLKTLFAVISKKTMVFQTFDWLAYKNDIWYYYLPRDIKQFLIVYLLVGCFLPVIIKLILKNVIVHYKFR